MDAFEKVRLAGTDRTVHDERTRDIVRLLDKAHGSRMRHAIAATDDELRKQSPTPNSRRRWLHRRRLRFRGRRRRPLALPCGLEQLRIDDKANRERLPYRLYGRFTNVFRERFLQPILDEQLRHADRQLV